MLDRGQVVGFSRLTSELFFQAHQQHAETGRRTSGQSVKASGIQSFGTIDYGNRITTLLGVRHKNAPTLLEQLNFRLSTGGTLSRPLTMITTVHAYIYLSTVFFGHAAAPHW